MNSEILNDEKNQTAILGGGCFWCLEAAYQKTPGVIEVISGYSGGITKNPTYREVCTGITQHAEVVKIIFDPLQTSFERLLDIFWMIHDPTQEDGQGADICTQYRSVIFYVNEEQKKAAVKSMRARQKELNAPIVTEILELTKFYKAEDYHQNYYNLNTHQPYCIHVIEPKLEKLNKTLGAD